MVSARLASMQCGFMLPRRAFSWTSNARAVVGARHPGGAFAIGFVKDQWL